MTRYLEAQDIQEIVKLVGLDQLMDELIEALHQALTQYSPAQVRTVARQGFIQGHGLLEWMPACSREGQAVVKMVGYQPTNPTSHGIPTILASLGLYDANTGRLECLMDGTLLTAMRTGAASAVASRLLAAPNSRTLGLVGCGSQAITQLHALSRSFHWDRVLAYDVEAGCAERFAQRVLELGLCKAEIVATGLEELVAQADVLCTATSHPVHAPAVLSSGWNRKAWLHINAVGADFPGKIEVEAPLLREAVVVPDYLEQAAVEGECQQLQAHEIGPDLATIVQCPQQRPSPQALTVFDSTGWALEDLVAAQLFRSHAENLNLGRTAELHQLQGDAKDPYNFLPRLLPVS